KRLRMVRRRRDPRPGVMTKAERFAAGKHLIDLPEPLLVRFVMERLRRTYDAFGFLFDTVLSGNRQEITVTRAITPF
ncbi:MAG TPA: hypothetical protein VK980_14780, partial [Sphingomonas sp.]|nr:hypothetical protein [Sphingomonas sp.]